MMLVAPFGFVRRARVVVVALAASLVLPLALCGPVVAAPPSLLDDPAAAGGSAAGVAAFGDLVRVRDRGVVRQREARVDTGVLVQPDGAPSIQPGQQLDLNLFSDARFTMTVDNVARSHDQGHTVSGVLDGVEHGFASLVVQGDEVAGQVST